MNKKAQINIIKNYLANDDIESALKELRKLIPKDDIELQKSILLISSKYASLKKANLANLIGFGKYLKKKQKVVDSIIQVVDDLNEGGNEDQEISKMCLDIYNWNELSVGLVGSTWRKKNGLEEIYFVSENIFSYTSVGRQEWLENDVSFDIKNRIMHLKWRHDQFICKCKFNENFSKFTELDETNWLLVAKKEFYHPTFRK